MGLFPVRKIITGKDMHRLGMKMSDEDTPHGNSLPYGRKQFKPNAW
jgi:hypothetical protein